MSSVPVNARHLMVDPYEEFPEIREYERYWQTRPIPEQKPARVEWKWKQEGKDRLSRARRLYEVTMGRDVTKWWLPMEVWMQILDAADETLVPEVEMRRAKNAWDMRMAAVHQQLQKVYRNQFAAYMGVVWRSYGCWPMREPVMEGMGNYFVHGWDRKARGFYYCSKHL